MTDNRENKKNEHPLHYSWVFWEHKKSIKKEDYNNSMEDVVEFSTVEDFWRIWTYMPKPSEVLYDGTPKKDLLNRRIDAFSLFKKGIRPEWEDPQNNKASELSTATGIDCDIDVVWENMVLALIGQCLEENDEICGCRVVDKYRGSRTQQQKPMFRLELWFKSHVTLEESENIKKRLYDAIADGDSSKLSTVPIFEYKKR